MKNTLIAMLMMALSLTAFATPQGDPPGLNKGGDATAVQGQAQGQAQGQSQNAKSTSVSGAAAGAIAGSQSNNSVETDVSNRNTNRNTADGGDSSSSSSSTGSTITTGGVVLNNNNDTDAAAAGAASVMPQSCQEGASGQSVHGGASSVFESAMCQQLKMAEVHQMYWKMYTEMGDLNQAAMHKEAMDRAVAKASSASESMYYPKQIGTFFLSILPVGLLFIL